MVLFRNRAAYLKELTQDSICILKKNLKFAFAVENRKSKPEVQPAILRTANHTSDIITLVVFLNESEQYVKLVIVININKRREFISRLRSNIQLKAEKNIELNSRRKSFECSFNVAKP